MRFYILLIFIISGCDNVDHNKEKLFETKDRRLVIEEQDDIICDELDSLLQSNFPEIDSTVKYTNLSADVFNVVFTTKESECYITICNSLYYNSEDLKGYVVLDEKLISFYNPFSDCCKGLIKPELLLNEMPKEFPNENSDYARDIIFDGFCKEYKIEKRLGKVIFHYIKTL